MNGMENGRRVLVISHNVFSSTTAMGKSLTSMLACAGPENTAQLYFHSEKPTSRVCERYFRITDKDMLRSVFTRAAGFKRFGEKEIDESLASPRTDRGVTAKLYQMGRKRTPLIYAARDAVWKLGKWKSEALFDWIGEFRPDLIFFASGDHIFPYRIACEISDRFEIPIVMWCCDDYYLSRRLAGSPVGCIYRKRLVKWARRVCERSSAVIAISDRMKRDYEALFSKPVSVIRISAPQNECALPLEERRGIAFTGGLGAGRAKPLAELGRTLFRAGIPGHEAIDVYSNEKNKRILKMLSSAPGIRFRGGIAAEEVKNVQAQARFLVHVESFSGKDIQRTAYSLSTKIGEYLSSGACILAYGPKDIASMDYLAEGKAAFFTEDAEEIPRFIGSSLADIGAAKGFASHAEELAKKNHSKTINDRALRVLFEADERKPDQ